MGANGLDGDGDPREAGRGSPHLLVKKMGQRRSANDAMPVAA